MELKIDRKYLTDEENDYCELKSENGEWVATVKKADSSKRYDPALIARLFRSAEELLEMAEGSSLDNIKKIVDYVKTGERDIKPINSPNEVLGKLLEAHKGGAFLSYFDNSIDEITRIFNESKE